MRIPLACLCYLTALLCKEIAVTLPGIFLLYQVCWPSREKPQAKTDVLIPFACLCATFGLYVVLRASAVGLSTAPDAFPAWVAAWQRLGLVFITAGFYLTKLLLPINLCYYSNLVIPGTWTEVFRSPFFAMGGIFLISGCVALKMAPRLGFALAWIGCALLPVLNIIALPVLAKENYLYIPSVGFCLVFSLVIAKQGSRTKAALFFLVVFCLIGLVYGAATVRRNNDYRDPVIFLNSTLDAMPPIAPHQIEDGRYFEGVKNIYTTHRNLGRIYRQRGQMQKAARAFEQALLFTPSYFSPRYAAETRESLGSIYEKTGELEKARKVLNEVLPVTSRPYYVHNVLGVICVRLDEDPKAEEHFKQALKIQDTYAPAHYNLGMLYMKLNRLQMAKEELTKAGRLDPKYEKLLPR